MADAILGVLSIVSIPLQLYERLVHDVGTFIICDLLQLGPYLPIRLGL